MPIFQRLNKDQIRHKDLFVILGQLIWEGYQNNRDYFLGINRLPAARKQVEPVYGTWKATSNRIYSIYTARLS